MQFKKALLTAALLTVSGFSAISSANAADAVAGTLAVNLEVKPTCVIKSGTGAIELGTSLAGSGAETGVSSTEITLNCSKGAVYAIALLPTSGLADGTGIMKGGDGTAEEIAYKLTSDASGDAAWGNDGNTVGGKAELYATDITNTVYATVTGSADVTPGTYTDDVTINVSY